MRPLSLKVQIVSGYRNLYFFSSTQLLQNLKIKMIKQYILITCSTTHRHTPSVLVAGIFQMRLVGNGSLFETMFGN